MQGRAVSTLLSAIPMPYKLLALAVVGAGLVALGWRFGAGSVQADWDKEKAIQAQAALNAEQLARAKEQSINRKFQEAQNAATKREQILKADADAARAAAGGLRNTIAALRRELSTATASACRQTADAALAVFGECSDTYQRVAEAADGHASDLRTLTDAWPDDDLP